MNDRDKLIQTRDVLSSIVGDINVHLTTPGTPVDPVPPTDPVTPPGGGTPPNTGGMDISDGAIKTLGYVNDGQTITVYVNRPGMIEVVPVSGTTIKSRSDPWGTESIIGGASVSYQRQVPGGMYPFSVVTIGGNIAVVFRG